MSTQAMPQEVQLAIGRLFRMLMSEPSASDVADFHNFREIIMNAAESHGMKNADVADQRTSEGLSVSEIVAKALRSFTEPLPVPCEVGP